MFECHITLMSSQGEQATEIAKNLHWKTSEIARDPVLGNDTYFYLTTHTDNLPAMMTKLAGARGQLQQAGIEIIREKIEVIIYDTKTKDKNQHLTVV